MPPSWYTCTYLQRIEPHQWAERKHGSRKESCAQGASPRVAVAFCTDVARIVVREFGVCVHSVVNMRVVCMLSKHHVHAGITYTCVLVPQQQAGFIIHETFLHLLVYNGLCLCLQPHCWTECTPRFAWSLKNMNFVLEISGNIYIYIYIYIYSYIYIYVYMYTYTAA